LGPTRTGKSTHLALIALQALRYEGMSIYCFDKGMSMYPTTKAVRGNHFEIAADDSKLAFCPLQFLETKGDRAWAMGWIDTCCALNGVITTPEQRNEIGRTIVNMKNSGAKTMSEFVLTVQDEAIRAALEQYTVDGMMGHLLDAEEDGLSLSKFTTFEIEALMNLGDKYALPVLLYLFRRIERNLHGQPAMILIDEAWLMLAHPAFKAKIKEWLKSFAKKNCLVLLSTQSLTDAANSGIMDIIIESTATRIYLPNRDAKAELATALYTQTGLNSKQIDIIATAIPKRQYYVVSEAGRRLYETALGPLALAFAGSTDKESITTIQKLEAVHGEDWLAEWLSAKGLNLNDYGVKA
jgi:type IV secretion/conjugal transfer VirB4 family ATPase